MMRAFSYLWSRWQGWPVFSQEHADSTEEHGSSGA